MMLAQVSNQFLHTTLPDPQSPQAIGWVCIILVCILIGLNAALDFWRKLTKPGGPEKRDVTISTGTVSAGDMKSHVTWDETEHAKLHNKIGGVDRGAREALTLEMRELRKERKEDSDKLQVRMSGVDKSLGGLESSTETQNASLLQIQATMNQVLQKLK